MLLTVVETPLFLCQAEAVWASDEHDEFVAWIAGHPDDGDIIPDTGGLRKLLTEFRTYETREHRC